MMQIEAHFNRRGAPLHSVRPVISGGSDGGGPVVVKFIAADGRHIKLFMERGGALSVAKQLQYAAVKKPEGSLQK